MVGTNQITICRLVIEFPHTTGECQGGSTNDIMELSDLINPYCRKQFLVVPKAEEDSAQYDKNFPYEVCRVNRLRFDVLSHIKSRYVKMLPIVPLTTASYSLSALGQISRLNRRYGIDIIQAHGITAGVAATIAGRIMRKPTVWMMHGCQMAYSDIAGKYESIVCRLFRPDHVLVIDDGSPARKRFSRLFGARVTIVYHGIDTEAFHKKPRDQALLASLGLSSRNPIILSAHTLIPVKGVKYCISSFEIFLRNRQFSRAVLLIGGEGDLREELEKMVYDLGVSENVVFLGGIDHSRVPDFLSISDMILATSLYSNLNRSVQEAMACEKPVIAFDSGGTSDVIHDMETGLLCESGNINMLAQKMLLLSENPELRQRIGENARKFILENRNWNSHIRTSLEVYGRLLQKKHHSARLTNQDEAEKSD